MIVLTVSFYIRLICNIPNGGASHGGLIKRPLAQNVANTHRETDWSRIRMSIVNPTVSNFDRFSSNISKQCLQTASDYWGHVVPRPPTGASLLDPTGRLLSPDSLCYNSSAPSRNENSWYRHITRTRTSDIYTP